MSRGRSSKLEAMKQMCSSCPFRDTGWTEVRNLLEERALTEGTPICHSTGRSAIVPAKKKVSRKAMACRGARNLQLQVFHGMGFISEPTDKAWESKCKELGLE